MSISGSSSSPNPEPGWLESQSMRSEGSKNVYTYTINLHSKGAVSPHLVTVEILEDSDLTGQQLAIKQLSHIVLLKAMHQLGKAEKNKNNEEIFQKGREIELVSDSPHIHESKHAALHFRATEEEASEKKESFSFEDEPLPPSLGSSRRSFYRTDLFSATRVISKIAKDKEDVIGHKSLTLNLTKDYRGNKTLLDRLEEIRRHYFDEELNLKFSNPSIPSSSAKSEDDA